MWKAIAVTLVRYGAAYCVFGVFGVALLLYRWFTLAQQTNEPGP